ncbi:MAG: hypothetical protein ACRDUA_12895 [Micromonosporaceae bacterium]
MSRPTSDMQIPAHQPAHQEDEMYATTTESVNAEITYRQSRIAQDFRRTSTGSRPRGRGEPAHNRHRWHLRLRHA